MLTNPNPVLEKLGFDGDAHVVIIHADDVGMCQATLPAFANLLDFGLLSSGSTMVPCPWFPEVADYCQKFPEVDMGVHLTLTSEWKNYRWKPISTNDTASGIMDSEGYFYRTSPEIQEKGIPYFIKTEIQAQFSLAKKNGIDISHIDTHMFALFHPAFISSYISLAQKEQTPLFILNPENEEEWHQADLDEKTKNALTPLLDGLQKDSFSLFDHVREMPLDEDKNQVEIAKNIFKTLPAGLSLVLLHPAIDTPELRAIAPDWRARVANYQAFKSKELRQYIKNIGIEIINYRDLRKLVQKQ
ncbi:MAG TPA: ChbG/HpnK family deacetylase [Anaerolineales bacterium]|nr:ChbG/HpnK family deacetylase [Anaerolineales bacterium]